MNHSIIPNTFISLLLEKELSYELYISSHLDKNQANETLLEYLEHIIKTYGSKGLSQLNQKEQKEYQKCADAFEQYESEIFKIIDGDKKLLPVFIFIKKAIYAGRADVLLRSVQSNFVALAKAEEFEKIDELLKDLQKVNVKFQ